MIYEQSARLEIKDFLNIRFFLSIIVILSACLLPLPVLAPWFIVLLGLMLALFIISCLEKEEDRIFLLRLFIISFLLRIFVALLLHLYSFDWKYSNGFFIADGWPFSINGWTFASMWRDGIHIDPHSIKLQLSISGTVHPYDFVNAAVYFILGNSPLSMLFLNCFLGSLTCIFIYFITSSIFDRETSKVASILCAFWPSLFLWSTQNLKEPLTIFLVVLCFWGLTFFLKESNPVGLIIASVSLFLLNEFRGPVAKIVAASIILHFFFLVCRKVRRDYFSLLVILVMMSIAAYLIIAYFKSRIFDFFDPFGSGEFLTPEILKTVSGLRRVRATANLAILPGYDISTPGGLIKYLPLGILAVLFGPFPWQVFSASQISAIPETIVWYIMFPCVVRGVISAGKSGSKYFFSIFAYIASILLILAIVEGNIGTMFRHKALAMIFLLIFMAAGFRETKKNRPRLSIDAA